MFIRSRAVANLRARWGQPVTGERRMDVILASHQSRLSSSGSRASLDGRTWEDLNLDAVFAVLDRTESTLGQHALYHRLRSAPVADHLAAFEALVSHFSADTAARERAQFALSRLRDRQGYDLWWLSREDAVETRPWYVLFPILSLITMIALGTAIMQPQFTPALFAIIALNVGVRYITDRRMLMLAAAFRQIAPVVTTAQALRYLNVEEARPLLGALSDDTPSLRRLKTIARWVSGDPLMLPATVGPLVLLLNDVVSAVYEYVNLAFLLDANGVYFGARDLRAHRYALIRVLTAVGEVDAAISTASFRAGRGDWTRPRFLEAGEGADFVGLRHPLLENAVPNSVRLVPGRGVLITGSNMAGKSTFLRTVGVNAVLAQTLNTCLASEYHAPEFNVRSCIGRSDDLLSGKSYYIVEVQSLLELVAASRGASPHLFLLDELFRGTNAVERIAAGQAVLLELLSDATRWNPHVVLAATHDGELVDLLPERYGAFHFGDAVGPEGLVFDYQLKPGPATTRNAIALLRIHGAPVELIRRAVESAERLDAGRKAPVGRE